MASSSSGPALSENYLLVCLATKHGAGPSSSSWQDTRSAHGQDALTRTRRPLYPAKTFELGVPGGFEVDSSVCRYAANPQIGVTAKKGSLPP